jgi:mono/diheme cytochrome c family protein
VDNEILTVALVVIIPAILLWIVFLSRALRSPKARLLAAIPPNMRPGAPDEKLEGPRLDRILIWGVVSVLATAAFIVFYWFPERDRQDAFAVRFEDDSIERGGIIFQPAPPLPEGLPAAEFKKIEKQIALGMGCANCHGGDAEGGQAVYTDPITGNKVSWRAPPLNNVFTRWDEEVVRFTIERGRPGTPMPTWGVDYGGPMTSLMVDDVIAWLKSLPGNQSGPPALSGTCKDLPKEGTIACGKEVFEARCAVCHGPEGQGKEDTRLTAPDTSSRDPLLAPELPVWYQGLALWKGDVKHLTPDLHLTTVRNGRRFAFMPPFAEAPAQNVPPPLYPLTDAQIMSVILYERSL